MKTQQLVVFASLTALISACTGFKSNYGCSGLPDGIVCKTPLQVYEQTNTDDRVGVYQADEKPKKSKYDDQDTAEHHGKKQTQAEQMVNLFAKPQFQAGSSPMPVLEQPKVLRIWVAPWKDENETLNWGSYMFTEITPRRWNFGDSVMRNNPVTAPNQADYKSPSSTQQASNADPAAANSEANQIMNMNNQPAEQPSANQVAVPTVEQTVEMQRQATLAEKGGF